MEIPPSVGQLLLFMVSTLFCLMVLGLLWRLFRSLVRLVLSVLLIVVVFLIIGQVAGWQFPCNILPHIGSAGIAPDWGVGYSRSIAALGQRSDRVFVSIHTLQEVGDCASASGPGTWKQVNESMSERAAQYQTQITGREPGWVYVGVCCGWS